nr:protein kinase [Verrucomicrobiota bacterium]
YLERYRLYVDPIGLPVVIRRSASEATFKAQDTIEHKDVALQVVSVTTLRSVVREQLEAEAKGAQQIQDINIPVLHDFGFDDGQIIYVTEYFDGVTADEWIKAHGPMPVGAVLRIAQQMVNASSVGTFHGIVHHAINPRNVMLVPGQTPDGEWPLIKVLNFVGVAPDLTPPENPNPESSDPINFASPEQLQTGSVDFRSQMYSLGATLWFFLTGAAPVGGAAAVEQAHRIPTAVRRLLAHMLAAEPMERPADPLALQAQIRDCLAQLDRRDAVASKFGLPLASEAAAPVPLKAPRRPLPWKPLALAAALMGLATVSAVALARHSRQRQAIGVPIGVSEKSAAAVAKNVTAPAEASAGIAQADSNIITTPPGTEPPVLSSAVSESSDEQTETQTTAAESSQQSARVASSSPPPTEESPAQVVMNNAPEPAPPSEGPATSAASLPTQTALAQTAPAVTPAEEALPSRKQTLTRVSPPEEKPAVVKSEKRSNNKRVRVPANDSPRLPRGSVRAQYLGTAPDGTLIFGLPSSEKVYAAPSRSVTREEQSPRRTRRGQRESSVDDLPVLPAEPPDE